MKVFLAWLSRIYNEKIESLCTRILYFFNTTDTYFLVAGLFSFFAVFGLRFPLPACAAAIVFAVVTARIADFFPYFILLAVPVMIGSIFFFGIPLALLSKVLLVNAACFFVVQFFFMGIPDAIVSRDPRVPFLKAFHSMLTIAPTTVSFTISLFFSFYVSFCLTLVAAVPWDGKIPSLALAGALLFAAAVITRVFLPRNLFSAGPRPGIPERPIFERVVILNIDGARKDIFDSLDLPAIAELKKKGASHVFGLETVYRALTNPAFASILTGTIPKIHGIRSNNFGQAIRTEGLPDVVPAIAYGSMHVKHFCKKSWTTRVVSLPRHSVYQSDDIMVQWIKDDMLKKPGTRLFIADFSEADFLAHAYGSTSGAYKNALRRIDKRIGDFMVWLRETGLEESTGVIICSDHGISAIDHSYLLAKSEKYVPFIMAGKGIKQGFKIEHPGKIMDICCVTSFLLGVPYPRDARGQVFTEIFEDSCRIPQRETFVDRFNRLKYDAEAATYSGEHTEIKEGDKAWWDACLSRFIPAKQDGLSVLDIGCGDGFVGERFVKAGIRIKRFVCFDVSRKMLEQAEKKLGGHPGFVFTDHEEVFRETFDVITVSSVFHHLFDPGRLATKIGRSLKEGGIVIGSHEPNQKAFSNGLFRAGAVLYKRLGGGVALDQNVIEEFNRLAAERYPGAAKVCREEILQTVEYHSPLEQYDIAVDASKGFVPREFFRDHFPGFELLELETYTTFFQRPWLVKHKSVQWLLRTLFNICFREGNLFRFVLRKTKP
ncbi:MAG TPA: alkaline phosphatase family protein [Candidatus Omnitrophota bacterium]|nr:alkaline phosphatase family protein [Candidatus Omnitrophota bacterium]HPS36990.1 alkaline phosphatase family protein [Candidatus Omnitrophota bacterium]